MRPLITSDTDTIVDVARYFDPFKAGWYYCGVTDHTTGLLLYAVTHDAFRVVANQGGDWLDLVPSDIQVAIRNGTAGMFGPYVDRLRIHPDFVHKCHIPDTFAHYQRAVSPGMAGKATMKRGKTTYVPLTSPLVEIDGHTYHATGASYASGSLNDVLTDKPCIYVTPTSIMLCEVIDVPTAQARGWNVWRPSAEYRPSDYDNVVGRMFDWSFNGQSGTYVYTGRTGELYEAINRYVDIEYRQRTRPTAPPIKHTTPKATPIAKLVSKPAATGNFQMSLFETDS